MDPAWLLSGDQSIHIGVLDERTATKDGCPTV
jgi:hypothetical protein